MTFGSLQIRQGQMSRSCCALLIKSSWKEKKTQETEDTGMFLWQPCVLSFVSLSIRHKLYLLYITNLKLYWNEELRIMQMTLPLACNEYCFLDTSKLVRKEFCMSFKTKVSLHVCAHLLFYHYCTLSDAVKNYTRLNCGHIFYCWRCHPVPWHTSAVSALSQW